MKLIQLEVGNLGTNCYIVFCEETLKAAVVDPGANAELIIAEVNRLNLKVEHIILTHGHADHIGALPAIKERTGAAIAIHRADADMLTSPQLNLSMFIGASLICPSADELVSHGDIIEIGTVSFKVLHTPGHTPGGICLLAGDVLISGDTLFAQSIGRTDFPGGSYSQLINSIKEQLLILDDEVKVLPGHGPETTIGWERKHNSFLV